MNATATTATTTPKRSLWNIGQDMEALDALLDQVDGDISDPQAQAAVEQWMGELQHDTAAKVGRYIALLEKWDGEAVAARAVSDRYQQARKTRENRIAAMKRRLQQWMEQFGMKRIDTPAGRSVAIQKNGGVAPLVLADQGAVEESLRIAGEVVQQKLSEILCGVAVPAGDCLKFLRVSVELDSAALRQAAEAGMVDFAQVMPRGESLRIR